MTLANFDVAATDTPLITASGTSAVLCIIFCNADVVARVINLYADPAGAMTSRKIISDYSIPAGDTFIWSTTEKFVLATGDVISATASAKTTNELVATISYYNL